MDKITKCIFSFIWIVILKIGLSSTNDLTFGSTEMTELMKVIEKLKSDVAILQEDRHYFELDIAALLEDRDLARYRINKLDKKQKILESALNECQSNREEILANMTFYNKQWNNLSVAVQNCCASERGPTLLNFEFSPTQLLDMVKDLRSMQSELMSARRKQSQMMNRMSRLEDKVEAELDYELNNQPARKQSRVFDRRQINEIELLIIIDYQAYKTWYQREGGDHGAGRQMRTQQAITKYVTSVVHGMNSIYKTLEPHGIKINISLVDIHFIQTLEDGAWLYRLSENGFPRRIVKAHQALDAFGTWVINHRKSLPRNDHTMLLTGFDLQSPNETDDYLTTGLAFLGKICSISSVSVVENQFNFEDVGVASHELGHSIGSEHDGKSNRCLEKDGYLMSPIVETNSSNRWYFSPCSIRYIRDSLMKLTSKGKNCLYRKNNFGHLPTPLEANVQLGELLSPDEQCLLIEGPGSIFCRSFYGENDYPTLCKNMWCRNVTSLTQNKQTCNTFLGSDGFVCGNQKICIKGKCVRDNSAPTVLDHCPHGDEEGIIWRNMTCSDFVKHSPEHCYDQVVQRKCCVSCHGIHSGDQQCPYGDRSSWCKTEISLPIGCYNNDVLCCATCGPLKQIDKPECPYGDRSPMCKTKLKVPMGCYKNEHLCCETCSQYKNISNPDCAYGDRSAWCLIGITSPSRCYKNNQLCCDTCSKYYNPEHKGCEYGDKSSWCSSEMEIPSGCYLNSEVCCNTCSPYYNSSNIGCEYGDKHSDCSLVEYSMDCYESVIAKQCCGYCGPLRRPNQPGCEYGDKSTWCKTDLRPDEDCGVNMDLCCGTCRYKDKQIK
ncbi:hypothetical protein SNE40_023151 [Patella caerulea]|uniref:Peptidase M12B domain-containing protein n=1 Tax=Patella caerulea TaxID=87958 RepID=A0AAN8FXZ7_PATCE